MRDLRHLVQPPLPHSPFPALRQLDGLLRRLESALVLQGGDSDDLAAERLRNLCEIQFVAILLHDVHHVDGHDHREPQLGELRRKVQVALDVRSVDDVQYHIRILLDEELPRHLLLKRIRRERIDAGKVLYDDVLRTLEHTLLLFHRDARPVSDVLVRTGQRVEKRRLAAVRVARKGDLNVSHL